MVRINQDKFDRMVLTVLQDCPCLLDANCNNCPISCMLYQELHEQKIEDVEDILNTLRLMFIDEVVTRVKAMKTCPRFYELQPAEFNRILSNQDHYTFNADGDLIAIY